MVCFPHIAIILNLLWVYLRPLVLKVWFLDQEHQPYLEMC